MIKKNGDGKWKIEVGEAIKIIIFLGGLLVAYFNTTAEIKNTIHAVETSVRKEVSKVTDDINVIKIDIGKIETTIQNNKEDIKEIKNKI